MEQQTQPAQSQYLAGLAKSFSLHLLTFMVYYLENEIRISPLLASVSVLELVVSQCNLL